MRPKQDNFRMARQIHHVRGLFRRFVRCFAWRVDFDIYWSDEYDGLGALPEAVPDEEACNEN